MKSRYSLRTILVFSVVSLIVVLTIAWALGKFLAINLHEGTAEERRKSAHFLIEMPLPAEGLHDAFVTLGEVGNIDSVPYLIKGLKMMPTRPPGGFIDCTWLHAHDALKKITGHDGPLDAANWETWWKNTGRKLPAETFPLKEKKKKEVEVQSQSSAF